MKKIRVMIIEDSLTVCELLKYIINSDSRLEVVSVVNSAEKALKIIKVVNPDVISMDILLPGIDGMEATQRIMSIKPTPIVIVSAALDSKELNVSMNSLRAGALAIVEKPQGLAHRDYKAIAKNLCTQLIIMSQVKVIRQSPRRKAVLSSKGTDNLCENIKSDFFTPDQEMVNELLLKNYTALGMVASTGGPNALMEILNKLPVDFPLPIFLVQHIGSSFLAGFTAWLDANCHFNVVNVVEKTQPLPGNVYLALPNCHLVIENGFLNSREDDKTEPLCPSGNLLFESMARFYASECIGVLLTGMGSDGAKGLMAIRSAGGYTITEDESTSVIYGMPKAAMDLGASMECLPLGRIADRLGELARKVGLENLENEDRIHY